VSLPLNPLQTKSWSIIVALQSRSLGYAPSSRLDLNKNLLRLIHTYLMVMTLPLKGSHARNFDFIWMSSEPEPNGQHPTIQQLNDSTIQQFNSSTTQQKFLSRQPRRGDIIIENDNKNAFKPCRGGIMMPWFCKAVFHCALSGLVRRSRPHFISLLLAWPKSNKSSRTHQRWFKLRLTADAFYRSMLLSRVCLILFFNFLHQLHCTNILL